MSVYLDDGDAVLHHGDALTTLRTMPSASVHTGPEPVTCARCQNAKATKIITWTVKTSPPDQDAEPDNTTRREAYCDDCGELELANHHRDKPRIEDA